MHQKQLEEALEIIQREDPSFKVTYEGDTGQTIVSGMGELHLEVILERIRHDFKVDASLGPLQVAYRETAVSDVTDTFVLDKMLGCIPFSFPIKNSLNIFLVCESFQVELNSLSS